MTRPRQASTVLLGTTLVVSAAWAQAPRTEPDPSSAVVAQVETAPVQTIPPDRYQMPIVLEPARRVSIMAMDDGVVRSLIAPLGGSVRETAEIVNLDVAEANARLKIAQAEVREARAAAGRDEVAAARLDAAQARAALAELAVERCRLRAPFAGRIVSYPVSVGQFVTKGAGVAELIDVSNLRALVPVDRTAVKEGSTIELVSEGKPITGKILAILPLPESLAPLREIAIPWAAAYVSIANPDGRTFEPGQRIRPPYAPTDAVAVLPDKAVLPAAAEGTSPTVRVVRSDLVTYIPVRILGAVGPGRMQVSGPFRQGDVAVVETNVPLAEGTFLRYLVAGGGTESAAARSGVGLAAEITPPQGGVIAPNAPATRIAPIGAGAPAAKITGRPSATKPASKPAATKGQGGQVPF